MNTDKSKIDLSTMPPFPKHNTSGIFGMLIKDLLLHSSSDTAPSLLVYLIVKGHSEH